MLTQPSFAFVVPYLLRSQTLGIRHFLAIALRFNVLGICWIRRCIIAFIPPEQHLSRASGDSRHVVNRTTNRTSSSSTSLSKDHSRALLRSLPTEKGTMRQTETMFELH